MVLGYCFTPCDVARCESLSENAQIWHLGGHTTTFLWHSSVSAAVQSVVLVLFIHLNRGLLQTIKPLLAIRIRLLSIELFICVFLLHCMVPKVLIVVLVLDAVHLVHADLCAQWSPLVLLCNIESPSPPGCHEAHGAD